MFILKRKEMGIYSHCIICGKKYPVNCSCIAALELQRSRSIKNNDNVNCKSVQKRIVIQKGESMPEFITKDSGERQEYKSGMKRDVQTGKPRYGLIYKPLLKRWASLMTRGAEKYGDSNWQLADSKEEIIRFMESAERHFQQFINLTKVELNTILKEKIFKDESLRDYEEDKEEDHAAAVLFNIAAVEYMKEKFRRK